MLVDDTLWTRTYHDPGALWVKVIGETLILKMQFAFQDPQQTDFGMEERGTILGNSMPGKFDEDVNRMYFQKLQGSYRIPVDSKVILQNLAGGKAQEDI